ncbi:MAG: KpsF/GutQ family sugar-phosphate isomerase [Solirubrobacterales bacterium]|nr:KpsF/GutQ family sugar-phosphate isomerase [Solirubrobacterales bacterium]
MTEPLGHVATPASVTELPPPHETGRTTIDAEIAALQRVRDGLGGAFDAAVAAIVALRGKVVTAGVGKSGHAARKTAATLCSVGIPAAHLDAGNSLHGDLGLTMPGDLALLFSKSGMTMELLTIVPHLRARQVTLVAIVGDAASPLALESDHVLEAAVRSEGCPIDAAPMASVLAAQAMGDAVAAAVMRARRLTVADFARLHPAGTLGIRLSLTAGDVMRRGPDLPRVSEAATLKDAVLEITRTGYGAVCVLGPGERLAGLITDGDIRRKLIEVDNLSHVPVAEVMTWRPLTVSPDLLLADALLGLEQRPKPFLTAPVVDDGRCVGLLRLHDVVRAHLPAAGR